MAEYRCYCLDRHGCIRAVTAISAETDEGARSYGALLLATCAYESAEIWDGRRHVGTVERAAARAKLEAARPAPKSRTEARKAVAAPGAPTNLEHWSRIDPPPS
jgi:hypothetical protein